MIRQRKPIARSTKPIRKRRKVKKSSMRYEVIDGKFRRYPDGREVCLDTARGWVEYYDRTQAMVQRQERVCGLEESGNCLYPGKLMTCALGGFLRATFQHGDGRGIGGARRNDVIDAKGNCAAHYGCNGEFGSRRIESHSENTKENTE